MLLRGIVLLLVPMVLASNPFSSNVQRTGRIDPFRGTWWCLSARTWDENGKEASDQSEGTVIRFDRDRIVVCVNENAPGDENVYRIPEPRNPVEGKIDLFFRGNADPVKGRYRFSDGRLFLCLTEDEKERPVHCGPGKNYRLFEFVPFQPKHLIQSNLPTPRPVPAIK